jgi:hypothetical protein
MMAMGSPEDSSLVCTEDDSPGSPDNGYVVNPGELVDTVTIVARVGSDLSNGVQKVRDGLMLPTAVGLGWEVDAPLARCANDWLQQMLDLTAAVSQASENLGRNAQSYLDAEGGFCPMPGEE